MNVEIGAVAALLPEKEYIKGIFVAVHLHFGRKHLYIFFVAISFRARFLKVPKPR
jgi:hypothetical protein